MDVTQAVLQNDCNFVIYAGSSAVWFTGTTCPNPGPTPPSPSPPSPGPGPGVQLCAGVYADNTGNTDVSSQFQACVNSNAGGTLAVPPGVFQISETVHFTQPIVFTTAGFFNLFLT